MGGAVAPASVFISSSPCFQALFKALGLNENDYKFGLTRVFFRPGKVSLDSVQLSGAVQALSCLLWSVCRV